MMHQKIYKCSNKDVNELKPRVLKPLKQSLQGSIKIPGDKSISHRAIILGSLAEGTTNITNFLTSDDCMHTIDTFRNLGVSITQNDTTVEINSDGHRAFTEAKKPLYFGNSGTTARLLTGLLASLPIFSMIHGDPHLTERPMARVVEPLRQMGAHIYGRDNGQLLPIAIDGQQLTGMTYHLPVKSAQVKSALLFAGLFATGETTIVEKAITRDHTERMLRAFGANLTTNGLEVSIQPSSTLQGNYIHVPGDISSAAFFLVAAAIVPNSHITLHNVGLNPTRTGIIDVMKKMGAKITFQNEQHRNDEPFGDIVVESTQLQGTTIAGDLIPRLIDEIPVIALLATQANGQTIIKDAEELRVKETDRIQAVVEVLQAFGANITETDDGMVIEGPTRLKGAEVSAYYDHRMAMMVTIASLITEGNVTLDDDSAINISYPQFFAHLNKLIE